jgi:hypothetical protein
VDHALSSGRQIARGSRPGAAHLLRFPENHLEIVAHDQHAGESESGVPPAHKDAGLVQHRGRALIILYGLVAFGQIQLRKIDGHQQLPLFIAKEWQKVA